MIVYGTEKKIILKLTPIGIFNKELQDQKIQIKTKNPKKHISFPMKFDINLNFPTLYTFIIQIGRKVEISK